MTLEAHRPTVSTPLLPLTALVGMGAALYGVYWDDAWHTDRGRDSLFSPPHVALYVGVTLAVSMVGAWALMNRRLGWRRFMADAPGIGIVGALAVLGSAPLDEWWHRTFGRDAVLWSPPHLFAVVGTIALATAFVFIADGAGDQHRSARLLARMAGAPVIGAWMVLVLEYDTDVPQFSPAWYLPVLAVALSAAALTVQAVSGSRQFAATHAGFFYTVAMVAVATVLARGGFSTPIIPAVLPALVVADVSVRGNWHGFIRSIGFSIAVFGVYVPYLRLVPGGVLPSTGDVVVGFPLAVAGVALTIAGFERSSRWRIPSMHALAAITMIGLALMVSPPRADAHDPGQGADIGSVVIRATVTGNDVVVEALDLDSTLDIQPREIVARRSGRTLRAPLSPNSQGWVGQIELDRDGRWFVYVTGRVADAEEVQLVEAWIPVVAGSDQVDVKQTKLYRPATGSVTPFQIAASVLIGGASLAILVGLGSVVRRSRTSASDSAP